MRTEPKIGDIVVSTAGHDAGKPFVVIAEAGRGFVLIADGKSRKVESPKLKNNGHLRVAEQSGITDPTNASLNKRLKKYLSDRRVYAEK